MRELTRTRNDSQAATAEREIVTKAAAINPTDNERLREPWWPLTSNLNGLQSPVRSLTAEKSRLMRENETLGGKNLSVQEQRAELRNQLNMEGRRVDVEGMHGTHAQQSPTTTTLVKKQQPELTGRQPYHEQRRYGTCTQLPTAARSDWRGSESENVQNTFQKFWFQFSDPTPGTDAG